MKQIIIITLALVYSTLCISQTIYNQTDTTSRGKLMLLGKTNLEGFEHEEFSWFQKNYDDYLTNDKIIARLRDSLGGYSIQVFYGTWCGDSRTELPRLYRILDEASYSQNIEAIALNTGDNYKQSPTHEERGLTIHRVPTIIVYDENGTEVNRIVEHPKETIERDLLRIVSGDEYDPNYVVVDYLENAINTGTIDSLMEDEESLHGLLADYARGSRELNTWGHVELASGNVDKAILIFELNSKMYPKSTRVYSSLGKAYYQVGDLDKALSNYGKLLSLDPKNTKAYKMIEKITLQIGETQKEG